MNFKSTCKMNERQIREIAKKYRKPFQRNKYGPADVIKLLETLHEIIPDFSFMVVNDFTLMTHAEFVPYKNIMYIRESVYEKACKNDPEHRFTIAHELGHALLHQIENLSFTREDEKYLKENDPEYQADIFAQEFLIPSDAIDPLRVSDIVKQYIVTYAVARVQYNRVHN